MGADVAEDAVRFVEDILEDILNKLDDVDIQEMVRQAEAMLNEIRSRDFGTEEDAADDELDNALDRKSGRMF